MGGNVRLVSRWGLAILASFALNFSLFALMPWLIQSHPGKPESMDQLSPVQVIRMKRPEPPVKKKEKIIPPKPEPREPPRESQKPAPPKKDLSIRPRLAFELNTRLPSLSTDLSIPLLDNVLVDVPVLKSHYEIGELDAPLTALVKIPPIYPFRAKRRGIEGFVTLEFFVTEKGDVDDITIIESRPETVFDEAVRDCVSRWKFRSGTVEGIPVETRVRTTIRFELEQ